MADLLECTHWRFDQAGEPETFQEVPPLGVANSFLLGSSQETDLKGWGHFSTRSTSTAIGLPAVSIDSDIQFTSYIPFMATKGLRERPSQDTKRERREVFKDSQPTTSPPFDSCTCLNECDEISISARDGHTHSPSAQTWSKDHAMGDAMLESLRVQNDSSRASDDDLSSCQTPRSGAGGGSARSVQSCIHIGTESIEPASSRGSRGSEPVTSQESGSSERSSLMTPSCSSVDSIDSVETTDSATSMSISVLFDKLRFCAQERTKNDATSKTRSAQDQGKKSATGASSASNGQSSKSSSASSQGTPRRKRKACKDDGDQDEDGDEHDLKKTRRSRSEKLSCHRWACPFFHLPNKNGIRCIPKIDTVNHLK